MFFMGKLFFISKCILMAKNNGLIEFPVFYLAIVMFIFVHGLVIRRIDGRRDRPFENKQSRPTISQGSLTLIDWDAERLYARRSSGAFAAVANASILRLRR